jgi:hypothetical protein
MVRCLVDELGADINQANLMNFTTLIAASAKGRVDIVRWLVKAGADTHASFASGVDGSDITAATVSKHFGACAEQTAYLEAKTHCSHPSCSSEGLLNVQRAGRRGTVGRCASWPTGRRTRQTAGGGAGSMH